MASNSSPTPPTRNDERYFCHRCVRELDNINQDSFTCPYCNQGFLEQLPHREEVRDDDDDDDDDEDFNLLHAPNAQGARDFNEFFRNVFGVPLVFADGAGQAQGSGPSQPSSQAPASEPGQRGQGQQQQQQQQQQQGRFPGAPWQGFLQNLLESLAGGGGAFQVQVQFNGEDGQPHVFGYPLHLHGNPGDYAWGPGGLDAIVTQLLNQFEGGAPPLTEEQIRNIPTVQISQEQVDKRVQCTVCMDDFKLQEKVRQLPCSHHFHDDCIIPWLTRHNTCPVCRKAVVPTTAENASSGSGSAGGSSSAGTGRTQSQPPRHDAWDVIEELD